MQQKQKIGIIGNGSWATAIAKILSDNGHVLTWWIRNQNTLQHLKTYGRNPKYLKTVQFPIDQLNPTLNVDDLIQQSDIVIFCVPAAYLNNVIQKIDFTLLQSKIVISTVKGILPEYNLLLNDYLCTQYNFNLENYIAITGPCHAEEISIERLSYLTFSCIDATLAASIAQLFNNHYLRTSYNHDIWGTQLAAVLKNIYAIGAGIAHSLGYGDNFISVYVTNCYREMYHFLNDHFNQIHPSEDIPDFFTSAYLGDLLVTSYSEHSRNRRLGTMLGKGLSVEDAFVEMNMVAEGYIASKCIINIAQQLSIDIPIAQSIYTILWEKQNTNKVFSKIESLLS